jgi:hypothetical protein
MIDQLVTDWLGWIGGKPCFSVYGKSSLEKHWRAIAVYATHRRSLGSRWPLWSGTCITWSSSVIVVGVDFAETLLREQAEAPASRAFPVEVKGGRMRDLEKRLAAGGQSVASASELMAHECGHTRQALRMGALYLPLVGAVTLFREGPNPWNRYENEASETGRFGGLVNGSVDRAQFT